MEIWEDKVVLGIKNERIGRDKVPSLHHVRVKPLNRILKFAVINIALVVLVHGSNSITRDDFPPGFVFGAGSSAYQVEGASNKDGRSPSIWDTFAHAGRMHGDTGDVACDEYHKYKEDVQLMVDTGIDAYRFSISWSRIIPNGRGAINQKGLQYYNNLINELISNEIQPHVTLHHHDLPQVFENEYGGWISRKIVKDFTAYADVCFREFGDRVKYWTTVNEANVFALGGYGSGSLPPGRCSADNCSAGNSSIEPYLATHHILLAHASAARLYERRYKDKQHGFIGINILQFWFVPNTDGTEDEIATQRAKDFYIGWYLNPLIFGDYPEIMKKNVGSRFPAFTSLESETIKGSFDFIGVNYYYPVHVKDNSSSLKLEIRDFFADAGVKLIPVLNESAYEFPITPNGLVGILEDMKQNYGNPLTYIHENGQRTRRNSSLEDWPRVKYLDAYIQSLLEAVRNGSNVKGYFEWSLLDAFELLDGYESSYGLYYIDLDDPDLVRQPKLSAHWYSHFLKAKRSFSSVGLIKSLPYDYFSH
ncbi:beta-glucosidase 11-like isoform X2 [Ziziphus jujuba]|uniref:Beta-glucosidase 11-like isoform X2 n=1 Tax=Ziziphus jujuba TaxID=326968 RepID=A0A6P4ALF9_ZIZJJ|nr:beta-glucosidase 11-like isoform X2 [Ziziphus jujuba]